MTGINNWKLLAAGFATMALLFGGAGMALAQGPTVFGPRAVDNGTTQRVSYADLNLASVAGRRHLEFRVGAAVNNVCGTGDGIHEIMSIHDCTSFAWAGARPQMERAYARAAQIAATGTSSIAPVAIAIIAGPQR
jgi:UrcA family protein